MQPAHAWEVIVDTGDSDGYDNSLGSFLLPPGWNDTGDAYPIVFNGMYDINDLTIGTGGKRDSGSIATRSCRWPRCGGEWQPPIFSASGRPEAGEVGHQQLAVAH